MRTIKSLLAASVSACALFSYGSAAQAQQTPIEFLVCQGPAAIDLCGSTNDSSYVGPGFDSALPPSSSSVAGAVSDASATDFVVSDAYDGWGAIYGASDPANGYDSPYGSAFNGLTANRQTETYVAIAGLPANSVRWFDSFTNNTASTITANIAFGGNLGSDSSTFVHATGQGYFVTGQGAPGIDSNDPVIAFVYGNNAYAFNDVVTYRLTNGDDNPYVVFPVTVAPGETVSLMAVHLLFGDAARLNDSSGTAYASDVSLAIQQAQLFVNSPVFDGLTVQQLETLLNWDTLTIDGSLPGAGAIPGISLGLANAFNALMNAGGPSGTGPLGYALVTPSQYGEQQAPGSSAETFALALGEAGGNVTVRANSDARAYLFGGYTNGTYGYAPGNLGFDGWLAGAGGELAVSEGLTIGLAGGYASGTGSIAGVYNSIANRQLIATPYMRMRLGTGTVIDGQLSVASQSWEYSRVAGAGIANAETDGWSLGARMGIAQEIAAGDYTFTPFANLSYLRTTVNGYTETGAGAANLVVPSFASEHGEVFAGLSVARAFSLSDSASLRAFVSAGVGTGFLDGQNIATSFTSSATTYATPVEAVDGAFGRVQAGLSAEVESGLTFSATYAGTFGKDLVQHVVGARLTVDF